MGEDLKPNLNFFIWQITRYISKVSAFKWEYLSLNYWVRFQAHITKYSEALRAYSIVLRDEKNSKFTKKNYRILNIVGLVLRDYILYGKN